LNPPSNIEKNQIYSSPFVLQSGAARLQVIPIGVCAIYSNNSDALSLYQNSGNIQTDGCLCYNKPGLILGFISTLMSRRAILAHDVFISYASEDKAAADAVCDQLEQKGIRCWIAPRDVMGGIPFAESITRAIRASGVFVILFSAHANKSPHVANETALAMNTSCDLLPFRIEDVQPSGSMEYYLSRVHWLDALTPPLEEHVDRLAKTIRQLLVLDESGEVENDADVEKIDDEVLQVEEEMEDTEGDPTPGDAMPVEEDQPGDGQEKTLPVEEQAEGSAPEAAETPLTAANILLEEDAVEEAVIGEVIQIPEAALGAGQELDALPGIDQEDEAAPEVEPEPAAGEPAAAPEPAAELHTPLNTEIEAAPTGSVERSAHEGKSLSDNRRHRQPGTSLVRKIWTARSRNITTIMLIGVLFTLLGCLCIVFYSMNTEKVLSLAQTTAPSLTITLTPTPAAISLDTVDRIIIQQRLSGAVSPVTNLVFSPDGRVLAASEGSDVLLWDVASGIMLQRLAGHLNKVTSLAISPGGRWLASGSETGRIIVWEIETGQILNTFDSFDSSMITDLEFLLDGKTLASLDTNGFMRYWDYRSGEETPLRKYAIDAFELQGSPDGHYLASTSREGARLWELWSGSYEQVGALSFDPYDNVITSAFSPDGRKLAIYSDDGDLITWNMPEAFQLEEANILSNYPYYLRCFALAFSKDGSVLASAYTDDKIRLWDVENGLSRTLSGHRGDVLDVAFSPGGLLLASAGEDGDVILWVASQWGVATVTPTPTITMTYTLTPIPPAAITPQF
jgi:WD40 repeat protein